MDNDFFYIIDDAEVGRVVAQLGIDLVAVTKQTNYIMCSYARQVADVLIPNHNRKVNMEILRALFRVRNQLMEEGGGS